MNKWYISEDVKPWEIFTDLLVPKNISNRVYTPYFIGYFGKKEDLGQDDIRIIRCVNITYYFYNEDTDELDHTEKRWLWDCHDMPIYWRKMVDTPNNNNIIRKNYEQVATSR